MMQAWDKEKSQSPTKIKLMTSWTTGGHSFYWATRTHGEQGHLTEFICDTARMWTVEAIVSSDKWKKMVNFWAYVMLAW